MSSLSRSLSPPLEELEIQTTNQILVAESPLDDAIADLSLITTVVVAPSDVQKSNLEHLDLSIHDHPLILLYEDPRVCGVKKIICSICCCSISDGPIYSCSSSSTECEFFIMHKSCAELPDKIRNFFHSEHTLFLRKPVDMSFKCVICDRFEYSRGFAYKCVVVDCEFSLHIKCALQYSMQDPQLHHDHSFILLKPTLFTCDACGIKEENKSASHVCTTCQIQVHQYCFLTCSPFPLNVKQIRHPHGLSLTFLSQSKFNCFLDDYDNNTTSCMICGNGMNGVICFYYCADCRFIAHASCALSTGLRDEYNEEDEEVEDENENQDRNPPITTLPPAGTIETIREISYDNDVGQKATDDQPRHFSHPQHCLILSNDPKLNKFCDGCVMPISVPYYTCADDHDECDFFLHKQCYELPHKIQHPSHNHHLTLQAKAVDSMGKNPIGIFRCRCCKVHCNGFTYTCGKCNFFMDVGCSLLRDPLIHDGHECALRLVDSGMKKCNACAVHSFFKFVCIKCDFNIHSGCASLPNTISHDCPKPEWGIRPYNLTTYSVDDGSGQYYCDICEEPRNPDHWFYYCKNCDYFAHPQCLLGKHRIKLGRTYLLKCHPHSLTLVKEAKDKGMGHPPCVDKGMGHPPCATCGDPCKGVAVLFCTECDIYIHYLKKCCDSG